MMQRLVRIARLYIFEAWYSYRALFAWQSPEAYISAKVVFPIFQFMLFLFMGRFAGLSDSLYIVIGNLLLLPAANGVNGISMTIGNERQFGTLSYLLGSPAPRAPLFLGRALFHILDGLFTTVLAIPLAVLIFGVDLSQANLGLLAGCLVMLTLTTSGLGMALGSLALITREGWTITTAVFLLFYVFCGVNFPVSSLPAPLQAVSYALPITRGIQVTRLVLAGQAWPQISQLVFSELGIGLCYAIFGYLFFRFIEKRSMSSGQWDLI